MTILVEIVNTLLIPAKKKKKKKKKKKRRKKKPDAIRVERGNAAPATGNEDRPIINAEPNNTHTHTHMLT